MLLSETTVNEGGLMRCCLLSIGLFAEENVDLEVSDGTIVRCRYDGDPGTPMILEHGVWRWQRPEEIE
jgi:hypothetical protein